MPTFLHFIAAIIKLFNDVVNGTQLARQKTKRLPNMEATSQTGNDVVVVAVA